MESNLIDSNTSNINNEKVNELLNSLNKKQLKDVIINNFSQEDILSKFSFTSNLINFIIISRL